MAELHRGIGEVVGHLQFLAVGGIAELFGKCELVVLTRLVLNVGDEEGTLADPKAAAPQEVTRLAHALRTYIGLGQDAATKQRGNFEGIDLVVLGLAAVDGLHVQRMAQDERNALGSTQVGEPIPGEHALGGHGPLR